MLYNSKWFEIFKHVANLTLRMNSEKYHHFGHFSYECDLVKCSHPVFCRAQKINLATSNTNILQSTWWKFLNFFPHILKPEQYKILWLNVPKNDILDIFKNLVHVLEIAIWEHFWWEHNQGTLGVKVSDRSSFHLSNLYLHVFLVNLLDVYSTKLKE